MNKQLEKTLKQQPLKRPILMPTVEEGLSPVKKKQDKVGRKGKTEISGEANVATSSSTIFEDDSDVQYQQHLAAKVRIYNQ